MAQLLIAMSIVILVASIFIGVQLLRIKFAKNPFYNESEPNENHAPEEFKNKNLPFEEK